MEITASGSNTRIEKVGINWSMSYRSIYMGKRHWHMDLEVLYVLYEPVMVEIEDRFYEVKADEMLFIPNAVTHKYRTSQGESPIIVFHFTDAYQNVLSPECRKHYEEMMSNIIHLAPNPSCASIRRSAVNLLEGNFSNSVMEYFAASVIYSIQVVIEADPKVILEKIPVRVNSGTSTLQQMIEFIQKHLGESISLQDVAEYVGFSQSYCSKYIKKKTQMNFLEYLNNERVEKALELLRTSDKPITTIAYETGFTSIQSFNRVFKSFCGISPTQYRKGLQVRF
jgi:YesN/AraC family two-component response regulator